MINVLCVIQVVSVNTFFCIKNFPGMYRDEIISTRNRPNVFNSPPTQYPKNVTKTISPRPGWIAISTVVYLKCNPVLLPPKISFFFIIFAKIKNPPLDAIAYEVENPNCEIWVLGFKAIKNLNGEPSVCCGIQHGEEEDDLFKCQKQKQKMEEEVENQIDEFQEKKIEKKNLHGDW